LSPPEERAGLRGADSTAKSHRRDTPLTSRHTTLPALGEGPGVRACEGAIPVPEKIVLAYSGGLDTSVAIRWLIEDRRYDVVALTVDVGAQPDFATVEQRGLKAGARKVITRDVKDVFLHYFALPALAAGAVYESQYPLATALARPLIAYHLVNVAREEGAVA